MRYELKYAFNLTQIYRIEKWLFSIRNLKKIHQPRKVNSIYYDDDAFSSAQDNIDGISERKKYRLRWYNQDVKKNFYEIKIKKNKLSKKIISSSKNDIDFKNIKNLFSNRNIDLVNKNFTEYLVDKTLEPKIKISYDRVYYITDKVRITIDTKLKFSLFENFNFSKNYSDNRIILEIKFDEKDYNDGSKLVNNCFISPVRFSKYVRGLSLCGLANYL
jgi:hypothetical protein